MESKEIRHRASSSWVYYSEEGIRIKSDFHRKPFCIAWSNVDFVSPTPSVKKNDTDWATFQGNSLMEDNALETLKFLNLHVVVKDYRKLQYGSTILEKIWGHIVYPIYKNLIGADDKPEPNRASIKIELQKGSLNVPLRLLLDKIEAHSKFELLCVW